VNRVVRSSRAHRSYYRRTLFHDSTGPSSAPTSMSATPPTRSPNDASSVSHQIAHCQHAHHLRRPWHVQARKDWRGHHRMKGSEPSGPFIALRSCYRQTLFHDSTGPSSAPSSTSPTPTTRSPNAPSSISHRVPHRQHAPDNPRHFNKPYYTANALPECHFYSVPHRQRAPHNSRRFRDVQDRKHWRRHHRIKGSESIDQSTMTHFVHTTDRYCSTTPRALPPNALHQVPHRQYPPHKPQRPRHVRAPKDQKRHHRVRGGEQVVSASHFVHSTDRRCSTTPRALPPHPLHQAPHRQRAPRMPPRP
jgi:hypothetical protein